MKSLRKLTTAILLLIGGAIYGQSAGPDQMILCTLVPGGQVTMSATGTGTWTAAAGNPGTATITSPSNPNTTITTFSTGGVYSFVWTTAGASDTALVTVYGSLDAGPDQTLTCITLPGGSATTAATGTGSWSQPPNPVGSATITNPNSATTTITSFTQSGTYLFVWRNPADPYSCGDTMQVTVSGTPPVPVLTGLNICISKDTIVLSGASTAAIYTLSMGGNVFDIRHFPAFTIAGGNGWGTAANQFTTAADIHMDASGNLYVLDRDNNRVQKFPAGSNPSTNGVTVAGGQGAGAAADQLLSPEGMFITAAGDIYVADTYNNRIQKFAAGSTAGSNATTVAGGNGPGSAANKLTTPFGVCVDSAGNLYVADEGNHRIQKFPAGSTSATNGITVAGGTQGSGTAQLSYPFGITVTGNGNMYVCDAGNQRVQLFPSGSTSGIPATTVAGGNGLGSAANQLNTPHSVFVNTNGDLYIADEENARIQKFPAGSSSATNGTTVAGGNGIGAQDNQLRNPSRVIRDASGYLYIADKFNNRIQEWSAAQIDSVFTPTAPGTYTATSTGFNGCVSAMSNPIVISYCLSDSVWPGDADHNGLANNNDLLPLGIAYGLNGFTRADQSIVWTAHYAQNWGVQFLNGTNTKHADCNGDGVVDANDTTAILLNFGLTHAKNNGYSTPWRSGIPGITLHYSKDTVQQGDTLTVSLQLGDSATSVANIYGLAFTYHYDAIVVDTTTTQFNFINSFLSNSTNGMSISRDFKTTGMVKAAVTGINHSNRSGYGVIAKFIATITTGNINGKDLAYYSNINYISDITAIDKDENVITLNAGIDSNQVAYEPTGIIEPTYSRVLIYPNPTKGGFTIKADIQWANTEYTLSDVTGRSILIGRLKGGETQVSIADLTPGIYMLHFADQKQSYKVTKY